MARVLIVEDETQVLLLAESLLEQAGHEVVTAHTVAEAQSVIHSGGSIDLVFTDMELGNYSRGGITIGELVGRAWPGTPVLYTSGRPLPYTPFLPKPYTGKQLTEAVAALLQHRSLPG